jgi:hypothetical protein
MAVYLFLFQSLVQKKLLQSILKLVTQMQELKKLLYVQHVMGLMETHKLAIGQKLPVRMSAIFLNN